MTSHRAAYLSTHAKVEDNVFLISEEAADWLLNVSPGRCDLCSWALQIVPNKSSQSECEITTCVNVGRELFGNGLSRNGPESNCVIPFWKSDLELQNNESLSGKSHY